MSANWPAKQSEGATPKTGVAEILFMKTKHILAGLVAIIFALILMAAPATFSAPSVPAYRVFAGGVAGIEDLLNPANSKEFRAAGGGLYLHNSGWAKLNLSQKQQVINLFQGSPVGLELGFGAGARANAWDAECKRQFFDLGVRSDFIAANAFADNNHPTVEQWAGYMKALRANGAPPTMLILPTFEYQNFRQNIQTLAQNHVSQSAWFQGILRQAGGIVFDTPSGYFFSREQAYRDWVVDALQWSRRQGLKSVVIASPRTSKNQFAEHTRRYMDYLRQHNAMPDVIVCENYNPKAPADYPNRVGSEAEPNTTLGVAWMLLKAENSP